jgi:hypothetical protein
MKIMILSGELSCDYMTSSSGFLLGLCGCQCDWWPRGPIRRLDLLVMSD